MSETPSGPEPPWANIAAWLFIVAVVALLAFGVTRGDDLSERNVVRYAAAFFCVFGIGFLLSSHSPDSPGIFRYLVRVAGRGRRWYRLSGLITRGEPRAAGLLCLGLAAVLGLLSVFMA